MIKDSKRTGVGIRFSTLTFPALFGLLACCMSSATVAQLQVSETVINMDASQDQHSLELTNQGSTPLNVQVDLREVIRPNGSGHDDELTAPVPEGVLRVEPANLTLDAHETASFVIHHAPRQLATDAVYRVLVTPSQTQQQGMNIHLNYHLLLFVRPQQAVAKVGLKRRNNKLAMINYGNSNVRLTSLSLCDESIDVCESLPDQRLYSKQRWPLIVPASFNIEHTTLYTAQRFGKQQRSIRYRTPSKKANQ